MRSSKVHLVVGLVLSLIGLVTVGSILAVTVYMADRSADEYSSALASMLLVVVLIFIPFVIFGIRCIRAKADGRHLGHLMLPHRVWRLVVGAIYLILGGFFLVSRWITAQSFARDSTQIGLGLGLTMIVLALVLIFSPKEDMGSASSELSQALDQDLMA